MEYSTCYCPNKQCPDYGVRGFGQHLVRRGRDRGIPRLLCNVCDGTFSARHGTAYFEIRAEERIYTIAMCALAKGNSLRGTGRIVGVDKDTSRLISGTLLNNKRLSTTNTLFIHAIQGHHPP